MAAIFLLEQVINGLLVGGYYLLIALGLSMIFSLGGIVNLAHGAFYALGAYFAVEIAKVAGFGGALIASPILVGLLGIERARLQAERLVAQARTHLDSFGDRADVLRELAAYTIERKS